MVTLGQSFCFQVEHGHLWIVITNPIGAAGTFVMVNMSTLTENAFDTSCVLHPGDHPDIHHDSVIRYADAREWWNGGNSGHDHLSAQGLIDQRQAFTNVVLRRIQDGALESQFFKQRFIPRVQLSLVA